MIRPKTTAAASASAPARRDCLVDGCSCRDSRFVSPRRAAYFATVAADRGETADRVIAVEPAWAFPADHDMFRTAALELPNEAVA